ncbi:MAG: hypothetical protein LBE62_14360 [Azonexus sp.]|nr:hypothetical protein [Azonexus sp.]
MGAPPPSSRYPPNGGSNWMQAGYGRATSPIIIGCWSNCSRLDEGRDSRAVAASFG